MRPLGCRGRCSCCGCAPGRAEAPARPIGSGDSATLPPAPATAGGTMRTASSDEETICSSESEPDKADKIFPLMKRGDYYQYRGGHAVLTEPQQCTECQQCFGLAHLLIRCNSKGEPPALHSRKLEVAQELLGTKTGTTQAVPVHGPHRTKPRAIPTDVLGMPWPLVPPGPRTLA